MRYTDIIDGMKYDENAVQPTVAIEVSLQAVEDGQAILLVSHSTVAPVQVLPDSDPLSVQLLTAFAAQLGGQIEQKAEDNTSKLVIEFALRPLTDAEDRNAPPTAA